MKWLLVLTLVLTGCMPENNKECKTISTATDKYYLHVTNGSSRGSYYCEDANFHQATNCIAFNWAYVRSEEDCPDLRNEFYNQVVYGGGTAEYRLLGKK